VKKNESAIKKDVPLSSADIVGLISKWTPPVIEDTNTIPKGDMPGDIIKINDVHISKAQIIFPKLLEQLEIVLGQQSQQKVVISIHGGSGVGKSEIGSLLAYYLNKVNIGSYIMSGDNYPHRIPKWNDFERLRIYRESGIKGLVSLGEYTEKRGEIIKDLIKLNKDADPVYEEELSWITTYHQSGRQGLQHYLGTKNETDFDEVNRIIDRFKTGDSTIMLKRMGREDNDVVYESVDFSQIRVLVIEWTHGNNKNLHGVDIPILLNSTPSETLAHRKSRNRDGALDSPFTTMVLQIEQQLLASQAPSAKIIVSKSGEILSFEEYASLMEQESGGKL